MVCDKLRYANQVIRREDYVTQLRKFIPVDIYSTCGDFKCLKNLTKCYEMLRRDYKFYLALDNSWCSDYVTEKLYRPLYYYTVPIVREGLYGRFTSDGWLVWLMEIGSLFSTACKNLKRYKNVVNDGGRKMQSSFLYFNSLKIPIKEIFNFKLFLLSCSL